MSIRHGLLALLERGPAYGYQLRAAFEESTGATWPLNIGQVYSTLSRLERDDLVVSQEPNEAGQREYTLTAAGSTELGRWFATPTSRSERPRDELAIKLALALTTPGVDAHAVVQTQRSSTIRTLQEYTRLKSRATEDDLSWLFVLDSMLFQAEAEVRWLDHCESRLVRRRAVSPIGPSPQSLGAEPPAAPADPRPAVTGTHPDGTTIAEETHR